MNQTERPHVIMYILGKVSKRVVTRCKDYNLLTKAQSQKSRVFLFLNVSYLILYLYHYNTELVIRLPESYAHRV